MHLCDHILQNPSPTIREVAKLVGNLVATSEAVSLARLRYRSIEWDKNEAMKTNKGDYNCIMSLTPRAISDIKWWQHNILNIYAHIHIPPYDKIRCK